jgi:tuftelin-interacting protein 11
VVQVLAAWLNSAPNYEEVTAWYQGWKSVLPTALVGLPSIADQLSQVNSHDISKW